MSRSSTTCGRRSFAVATADRIPAEGALRASQAVYEEVVGKRPGVLREPPALSGLPASRDEVIRLSVAWHGS